jgi:DNA-binding NarL/FixJ family response regulator
VTPATVANWIDQGHLKGHRTPTGRRRVLESDLTAFLREHGMPVPAELEQGRATDTVVVVDDEPVYLQALVRALERSELDVEVVEATSGMDGLLEIGRTQPQVIVLDFGLPDLNADQVIQRLLAPGRSLEAEVIVVTGGLRTDDEERLRRTGVRTIIAKADGMDLLVDAVREALVRQHAVQHPTTLE